MTVDQILVLSKQVKWLRRLFAWVCIAGLIVAAGLVGLSVHVYDRQNVADARNRHTVTAAQHDRQAICAVLLSIPPGHRSPAIRKALSIDSCKSVTLPPPKPPHIATTTHPTQPTAFVVSPAPTATRTVTARPSSSPRPSRSSQPRPSPSRPAPTPSETPTCPITLLTIRVCN